MRERQQLQAAFASSLRHGTVLLFFVLLPLATTWPLAAHLGTHVPGEVAGDNLSTLWSFWWMRQALGSGDIDFWRTTFLFHPGGVDLVQHTHTALNALIGATVFGGVSEITALNLVILGTLTLAGFGTYLLAWDITRHRGASIVAGVLFCAAPFFTARLLGHFNFVSAWGLPFFAWTWLRALRPAASRTGASRAAVLAAGGVLAAVAYTDYYYLAYLMLFIVCVLALRWGRVEWVRPAAPIAWNWIDTSLAGLLAIVLSVHFMIVMTDGFTLDAAGKHISMRNGLNVRSVAWVLALVVAWRRVRWRPRAVRLQGGVTIGSIGRDLAITGSTLVILLVAILPLLSHALELWQRGDYVELDKRWHSAPIGIDPLAMLFGNPYHPLYGAASRALYNLADIDRLEGIAWFGVAPIIILIVWRRHWLARDAPERADVRLWLAIGAVFGVWMLGSYLRVAGTNTGLWLPASLVQYVSILSNARVPTRAIVMVYLSVGVLVAIAIAARARVMGTETERPLGAGMMSAIAAIILIDFAAQPIALYRIDRPAIFQQLAAMPPGAVCVLPLGLRDGLGEVGHFEHRALADQLTHARPIVGGFIARLPKSVLEEHAQAPVIGSLLRLSSGETISDAELARDRDAIARNGVPFRYVVIYAAGTVPKLRAYVTSMLPVRLIASQNEASQNAASENGASQNGAGEHVIELYEVTGGAAR